MLSIVVLGCTEKSSIEGLWVVKTVKAGKDVVTPNARWTRFHADFTQESGNGRFQHSNGTWDFNPDTKELSIVNTNGLDDPNAPFKVQLLDDSMVWERTEEGMDIKIILERSTELPETYGDKILGLWALESAKGEGKYFNEINQNHYIYFGWDRRFRLSSEKGRVMGVYNVHGHKPELELIPYGDQLERDFWRIEYGENSITLKLLNSEQEIERTFKRIRKLPE